MIRQLLTMVTLPNVNEQATANTHQFPSGATLTREYREFASFSRAMFFLDVTAVSGTSPTLDVVVQVQDPISLKWQTVVTFAQQTAVTGTAIALQTLVVDGLNYRAQFTVGGTATPTVTCSLVAIVSCEIPVVG